MIGHSLTAKSHPTHTKMMLDSVKQEIIQQKILFPDIVLRQSVWETGWYNCKHCSWDFNNLFGFRHSDWITKDNPAGYKKFKRWQDSIDYYKKWQSSRYKGGDYYEFLLSVGYAEAGKQYIKNLKSISL